jgi:putative surface cell wall-binding protein
MKFDRPWRLIGGALLAAGGLLATALPADATSATATISAGTLAFQSSPSTAGFSATLTGLDQSVTSGQTFDVSDATGSGAGWNVTATSTTFTAPGSHTLPTSAVTIGSAPGVACDAGSTCTVAGNSVAYPYTLAAETTAPTATKLYNATANSGLGRQTVTATMALAIPANTYAGNYTSTWTYSLVSGP